MKEIKPFIVLGAVIVVVVGGLWALVSTTRAPQRTEVKSGDTLSVTMENGKQIITILARGGYFPNKVSAQAGIPTVLRMKTAGSFDCSTSLVLPSIGYNGRLDANDVVDKSLLFIKVTIGIIS